MKNQRLFTLMLILFSGCERPIEVGVQNPDMASSFIEQSEKFGMIADRAPGFAGMSLDDEGVLVVAVKDGKPASKEKMGAAIAAVMGRLFFEQLAPYGSHPEKKNLPALWADMKFVRADYDFRELLLWRDAARAAVAASEDGVVVGVDEARNRVVIRVKSPSSRGEIERILKGVVPQRALVFTEDWQVVRNKALTDLHRPVPGGVKIQRDYWWGPRGYKCSAGFNATIQGKAGFVTAAHCTHNRGVSNDDLFHQPSDNRFNDNHKFGNEEVDPEGRPCGNIAPGKQCRFSDAAFIEYKYGATGGPFIARPRHANNGSREIDPARPVFRVVEVATATLRNQRLHKVGHVTGWTWGIVGTASDDAPSGGWVFNGQAIVERQRGLNHAMTEEGDSGAPVFEILSASGDVRLHGINIGHTIFDSDFIVSKVGNIVMEMGRLGVSMAAPTSTAPPSGPPPSMPSTPEQCMQDCNSDRDSCRAEGRRPQDCLFEWRFCRTECVP